MRRISSYIPAIAVCLAAIGATFCFGQNRFIQVPSYPAGGSLPTLLAQHDVNGDGKLDLIVLNVNAAAKTETVSLLLGTGTGGYEDPTTMGTYPSSYGVPLAGDVNGDGHLDLIFSVAGTSPQTRVYLGSGDTFETTAKVSTGVNCGSFPPIGCVMQLADLNKDGKADLVQNGLLSDGLIGVAVMLGEGDGYFEAPVYAPGTGPFAIGDFNNDGIPDLADTGFIGDSYGLQILLGNGNGTFQQATSLVYSYPSGLGSNYIGNSFGVPVAADLRGNGDTDLIVPQGDDYSCGFGGFLVLLGNGDGTFASNSVDYSSGGYTYNVTVLDMNGDGKPDIVAANQEGGTYSVLLNQGNGKFGPPMNYMTPQGVAGAFVVGDLTGNGRPDLTVSTQSGVDVFLNEGGGKLKAPQGLEVDGTPLQTWADDMNRDGIEDLVTTVWPGGISSGLIGVCFSPEPIYGLVLESQNGVPFANAVNAGSSAGAIDGTGIAGGGDFNGDGWPDLLTADSDADDGDLNVLQPILNNQKGSFTNGPIYYPPWNWLGSYAVGDFNRDGKADVAGALGSDGGLQILIGDGTGNFNLGANYTIDASPTNVFAQDLTGDGKLDIVVISSIDKVLQVLLGNGDGTFQAAKTYDLPDGPVSLTFADFNRDGKLDIAVGGGSDVQVLLNNGNGTFKAPVSYAVGGPVAGIATIDLTGNGNDDVLVADSKDNKIFMLAGNGKGTLAAPVDYYVGGSDPLQLIVADYNLDGAPDVAVADGTTQGYMILYNTGGTKVTLTSSNKTPTAGEEVTFTVTVAGTIVGSSTPTGTVIFKNGSAAMGTVALSGGKATFHTSSLTEGSHSITAIYDGNSSFNPHTSAVVTETVK